MLAIREKENIYLKELSTLETIWELEIKIAKFLAINNTVISDDLQYLGIAYSDSDYNLYLELWNIGESKMCAREINPKSHFQIFKMQISTDNQMIVMHYYIKCLIFEVNAKLEPISQLEFSDPILDIKIQEKTNDLYILCRCNLTVYSSQEKFKRVYDLTDSGACAKIELELQSLGISFLQFYKKYLSSLVKSKDPHYYFSSDATEIYYVESYRIILVYNLTTKEVSRYDLALNNNLKLKLTDYKVTDLTRQYIILKNNNHSESIFLDRKKLQISAHNKKDNRVKVVKYAITTNNFTVKESSKNAYLINKAISLIVKIRLLWKSHKDNTLYLPRDLIPSIIAYLLADSIVTPEIEKLTNFLFNYIQTTNDLSQTEIRSLMYQHMIT